MMQCYFNNCGQKLIEGYDLAAVQEAISDHEQVVLNLIQFYFPDADLEVIKKSDNLVTTVGKMIMESEYNDSLKSALYAFFIDPDAMIKKLYYELMKKEFQLSQQYEKAEVLEVQQRFDLAEISEKWGQYKDCACNIGDYETVYVTFCILPKNCFKYELFEDSILLILGTEYMAALDYRLTHNAVPDLDVIGNALAEKNRVDILELILQKEEITIKDI